MKTLLRRAARAGLALLLGLLLVEGVLQVLALAVAGDRRGGGGAADERSLLCLGDSNVFGVGVRPEDAWPGQLEGLLNARSPGGPWRAVNLGMPGLNSRQVARQLAAELDAGRPAAVLVTVGVNNIWSWLPDSALEVLEPPRPPWHERLRLAKLARLAVRAWSERAEERRDGEVYRYGDFETTLFVERPGGVVVGRDREGREVRFDANQVTENLEPDAVLETLAGDVAAMKARCERDGVPLLLVSYGGFDRAYERANANLREAARRSGLPLVECDRALERLERELGYEALFFPDQHPRETGYAAIARLTYAELVARGVVPGEAPDDPLAGLTHVPRPPAPIHLVGRLDAPAGSPDALRVEVRGEEPGRPFQILLSEDTDGPRAEVRGSLLPLVDDGLFRFTLASPAMHGTIGLDGVGAVPLAPLIPAEGKESLRGDRLRAVYVLFTEAERLDVRWISDAARLVIE